MKLNEVLLNEQSQKSGLERASIIENENQIGRRPVVGQYRVDYENGEPAVIYKAGPMLSSPKDVTGSGVQVMGWNIQNYVREDGILYAIVDKVADPEQRIIYSDEKFQTGDFRGAIVKEPQEFEQDFPNLAVTM